MADHSAVCVQRLGWPGPIDGVSRSGVQRLIQQAVEAELAEVLAHYASQRGAHRRAAVVRNGYLSLRCSSG